MPSCRIAAVVFAIAFAPPCVGFAETSESSNEEPDKIVSMAFGWPFLDPAVMETRGGTTQASKVTLAEAPSDAWTKLRQQGLSARERDRRAILAMSGSYRVSFQFIETMGFSNNYSPSRPYFSWATEHVRVLVNRPDFVSLQHILVMYFMEDGEVNGPMVMKHWRQDWSYEDRNLHVYRGNSIWERDTLSEQHAAGGWTQAVYQVDDSPRYEAYGRWTHANNLSRWTSDDAWRPLPRREFSVRDDYNVLAGTHSITITPTGWVHLQDNRKLQIANESEPPQCIACEVGINRYERIESPSLQDHADAYWIQAGDYWKEVRAAWAGVFRSHDRFKLKKKIDDKSLFEEHFGFVAKIEATDEEYDAEAGRTHAQETVNKFLLLQ